jgi:uncharacterized protein YdeI (YjbR/CyaY-like superfamily)
MKRPDRSEVLVFTTTADFRSWLEKNHDTATEAWIGYFRKGVPKTSQTYDEAVDQALCFGWIDGITYRVDDEVTTNRFTPRRKGSYWSSVNIGKVERLKAAGMMADAGLRAFEARDASAAARYSYENRPADLPPEMLAQLHASDAARAYWDAQSRSYRRTVSFWVVSAKQQSTRERRLAQLIADCEAGRPVKAMGYGRTPEARGS